jgi:dienelactone hydrolase
MIRQWRAATFWLRDRERVTNATWFSARDPQRVVRRAAVLVLSGIGHEEETVAVGLPEIAGANAARGLMAMSFDFSGNGQSLQELAQPEIVTVWCDQIVAAIEHLRSNGAEKVAVIALRFAGALALEAAKRTTIDALVLWSPILSGRRYVRELRMMQAGTSEAATDAAEGGIAVGSFTLPASVVASMSRLEAGVMDAAPAPSVLYVESPERQVDDRAVSRMREVGATVDVRLGGDDSQFLFTATDNSSVPVKAAREVAQWIDERVGVAGAAKAADPTSLPTSTSFQFAGREIRESFVSVGELGLSGVLVEPSDPDPALASVLYLSMGPGRSFVHAARQAASEGRRALRFDFAGFGLSPMRPRQSEPELYGATGSDDVRLGVDYLTARGATSIVIVGFCAGAWSSVVCPPIPGVVAIAAINIHLSVRLRKAPERSKNNAIWQPDLGGPGQRTLLTRLRDRFDRLAVAAGPPIRWLTTLGEAGARVGLFFDAHDLGFQYWDKVISGHFRPQVARRTIEVHTYPGLGHLAQGQAARRLVLRDIANFIRRSDAAQDRRDDVQRASGP